MANAESPMSSKIIVLPKSHHHSMKKLWNPAGKESPLAIFLASWNQAFLSQKPPLPSQSTKRSPINVSQ